MIAMFNTVISHIKNGAREIECMVFGGDRATLYDVSPWGIDAAPPKKQRGVCDREGRFILGYQGVEKKADYGELRIYATDKDGAVVSEVHMYSSGKIAVEKGTVLEVNIPAVFNNPATFNEPVAINSALTHKGDLNSSGGSFKHEGVNVGSTHGHRIKSGSSSPGPTDVPQ